LPKGGHLVPQTEAAVYNAAVADFIGGDGSG
jgi:hypothetical protein